MIPAGVIKAKARFNLAEKHAHELNECQNYSEFCEKWYQYLIAFNNVLNMLRKASADNPTHRQWFGRKENERKKDQLSQYLFVARDDDEHGIDSVLTFVPGSAKFTSDNAGDSTLTFDDNDGLVSGKLHIKSTDGKLVGVRFNIPHVKLKKVIARGNIEYDPPKVYDGKILTDTTPNAVARLGLHYLAVLIEEADGML